jgi:E3 ubiquitin-protein ligase MARCH6
MLDICTVSLFPQGGFGTRKDFLLYAPVASAFYHWVIGTMFM